jgi:hypothetical protein
MTKCYDTVDQVKVPNMLVRTDIGARLDEQLPQLHRLGYCRSMDYGGAP